MSWIVVYQSEEEVIAAGYIKCEMEMRAWYVKEGHPTLHPIHAGYGYLSK